MAKPHLRDLGKERFWRRQVGGWKRSGLTIRDYGRRQGLAEPSFYALPRVKKTGPRQWRGPDANAIR